MLSRTADHLFWMARYIERADKRGNAALAAKAVLRAAQVKRAQRAAVVRTPGVAAATTRGVFCAPGGWGC
jgi:uncharacterized alpha-E superfamily protein